MNLVLKSELQAEHELVNSNLRELNFELALVTRELAQHCKSVNQVSPLGVQSDKEMAH